MNGGADSKIIDDLFIEYCEKGKKVMRNYEDGLV